MDVDVPEKTLGVLELTDSTGFMSDFPQVLQRLKASGFFITEAVEHQLLERHRTRRTAKR
jgi:predicted nucleic acid-binding protein